MRAAFPRWAAALASAVVLQGSAQAATPPRVAPAVQRPDPPLPVPRPHFPEAVKEEQGPPAPPKKPVATPPAVTPPGAAPPPAVLPSVAPHAGTPPGPTADASCQAQLKAAGAVFDPTPIGPQSEPLCIVADAVRLTGLDPASGLPIDFPDRPTLACTTALIFADYLRTLLVPLTRGMFGTAITSVGTGPGFECRTRDHVPGAKISAHGQGLAVDIADIALANGRHLAIGAPKDDTERGFDKAARAGGCGFFHTALGPGADSFHETHWHFDLQPRGAKGNAKICQ